MPPANQASSSKLKPKPSKSQGKSSKGTAGDIATDIDSIFSKPVKPKPKSDGTSGKGKEKAKDSTIASKLATEGSVSGLSKKKKKAKKGEAESTTTSTNGKPATRVVEVVDTAIPKVKEVLEPVKTLKKRGKKDAEEDEIFADSRGTGPSMPFLSRLMSMVADLQDERPKRGS